MKVPASRGVEPCVPVISTRMEAGCVARNARKSLLRLSHRKVHFADRHLSYPVCSRSTAISTRSGVAGASSRGQTR